MLMHLPTWDVLLPLIYYLCPTLLFGALRLKFHLLFDFFFFLQLQFALISSLKSC